MVYLPRHRGLLGAFREGVIVPAFGDQAGHVIGTSLFIAAMLTLQWMFVIRVRQRVCRNDLWLIGLMWTSMTVCFEFGFFHFAAGVPWKKLLADYNLFTGRLWLLVLLATLLGPPAFYALQMRGGGMKRG